MKQLNHVPDYVNGRDENTDVVTALCGAQPKVGDLHENFGLLQVQVNCEECKKKQNEMGFCTGCGGTMPCLECGRGL